MWRDCGILAIEWRHSFEAVLHEKSPIVAQHERRHLCEPWHLHVVRRIETGAKGRSSLCENG